MAADDEDCRSSFIPPGPLLVEWGIPLPPMPPPRVGTASDAFEGGPGGPRLPTTGPPDTVRALYG